MRIDADLFPGFRASRAQAHEGAQVEPGPPLRIVTPAARWSYAFSVPAPARWPFLRRAAGRVRVEAELEVQEGEIGVACTRPDLRTIVSERSVRAGEGRVRLCQHVAAEELGWLVVRNVAARGGASRATLHGARVRPRSAGDLLDMIDVGRRRYASEELPDGGGVEGFDDEGARRMNQARLARLVELDLPLAGKRVLDVGCGVGHFSRPFVERGCSYVGVDGRAENIARMKELYPDVEGHVGDVQVDALAPHGRFDVVLCFGLLYHLESPIAALRNVASVCDELLLLETMVCDSSRPVLLLADEPRSFNQALAGLGCRPSPSFLAMALQRVGFDRIYAPRVPPRHEDFEIEWRDDLARQRDGHDLRCMFLAARQPIASDRLLEIL